MYKQNSLHSQLCSRAKTQLLAKTWMFQKLVTAPFSKCFWASVQLWEIGVVNIPSHWSLETDLTSRWQAKSALPHKPRNVRHLIESVEHAGELTIWKAISTFSRQRGNDVWTNRTIIFPREDNSRGFPSEPLSQTSSHQIFHRVNGFRRIGRVNGGFPHKHTCWKVGGWQRKPKSTRHKLNVIRCPRFWLLILGEAAMLAQQSQVQMRNGPIAQMHPKIARIQIHRHKKF